MQLTLDDVAQVYAEMRRLGCEAAARGDHAAALRMFETAARAAYNFNWIYTDARIESDLRSIAERVIGKLSFVPQPGRVVFYDSWGLNNRGLTQQYVRALKAMDLEVLYVFENEPPKGAGSVREELEGYPKFEIFSLDPRSPQLERIKALCEKIRDFRPEKLLAHISPWATEAVTTCYALPQVTKYFINLTDHAFWLGAGCLDYSLEFSDYGCTVSLDMRGLDGSQLLLNPYYPVTSREPFKGFPAEAESHVVIFSGASFYKIYGRDGAFFRLVARLLQENPEAIVLFAGGGESGPITDFIRENGLEKRFILLGSRSDINEVFAACDIYLSTYPVAGGLMTQLAALNAKPVLAFTTADLPLNFIESVVCHNQSPQVTFTDMEAFFAEARRLVLDEDYRRARGAEIEAAMITSDEFDRNFAQVLTLNRTQRPFKKMNIDYAALSDLYLEVENKYQDPFKRLFLKTFRGAAVLRFPLILLKTLPALLRKLLNRNAMLTEKA